MTSLEQTSIIGMDDYQILEWDSNFFGFTVARILQKKIGIQDLRRVLNELKTHNVTVAYWAIDNRDLESRIAAESLDGFLADQKITYAIQLDGKKTAFKSYGDVEVYQRKEPCVDLERLSIQSGEYSRFNVDPNFSRRQFENLYKIWIKKSTDQTVGGSVLVFRDDNSIIGMIAIGHHDDVGQIHLIAVDENYRGKKIGSALIDAAHRTFWERGNKTARVITQKKNFPACRLYEKWGYQIEKIEYFYHFWLKNGFIGKTKNKKS